MQIDTSNAHQLPYVAYLVRLWQETSDGPWRASAQSVQTGEIVRFGSQQALFAFIADAIQRTEERVDDD